MRRMLSLVLLASMAGAVAVAGSYYDAIQRGFANPLPAKEFEKLEKDALADFGNPDVYDRLATAFGNSTERVWAIIYGEVFCNLTSDASREAEAGARIFAWLAKAITFEGKEMNVALTRNAELSSGKGVPFESTFEMSVLFAAMGNRELNPASIAGLTRLRRDQLEIWKEKKLPVTQLIQWQQSIEAAGHFDAYNYWLFRQARPSEFDSWLAQHRGEYEAWIAWHSQNAFRPTGPDFQRLRQAG